MTVRFLGLEEVGFVLLCTSWYHMKSALKISVCVVAKYVYMHICSLYFYNYMLERIRRINIFNSIRIEVFEKY